MVYAVAFGSLFTFFWDFGLGRLIIRDIAKDRADASLIFSSKLKFQIISCITGLLVLSVYVICFETRYLEGLLVLIFGIWTALNFLSNSFRSVFIAFERAEYEAYFNFSHRSLLLLGILWAIHIGWNLICISLVLLIFSVLNLIGSWVLVEMRFFHLSFRKGLASLWPTIKDSFPIALMIAFATFYSQINKILLLKWKGADATGIYGAVDVIVITFMIISNSVVLAALPIISRENRVSKEKTFLIYKNMFKVLSALGLPIAVGGMLLNKEIVSLLYGNEFYESSEVLKILIWVTPILFLTNFTGNCLVAIGRQRQLAYIYAFNTMLNVTLNLILIPYHGYTGAAIAFLATEGVNLVLQYQVLKYYWGESVFDVSFLKIFLSLGVMGFFIYWLRGWNIFIILLGAVVIYCVSLFSSRIYSKEELYNIKGWLS
ncbi:MAG: flippase [Syntrophaceae bacterium]|nr:flippase [Syntrophaceae bacterium]